MRLIQNCLLTLVFTFASLHGTPSFLSLKDNLQRAQPGDFIITSQNKNYTLFHIFEKTGDILTIEEITLPISAKKFPSWKEWVLQGAPRHTGWILYSIKLSTAEILRSYSVSKKSWVRLTGSESFLPTLLNLNFTYIPMSERKKVGPPPTQGSPDWRPYWQPKMTINGQTVTGVIFDGWQARWPRDNTDLSGKLIEVYLPAEGEKYPSYFPFWLQVRGGIAKATLRIIDSGTGLHHSLAAYPNTK